MFYLYLGKKGYATLVILICMLMIPISVYAVCKVDIEVESTIEIEKINKIPGLMAAMSNEEGSCIFKYEGPVTDEVGKTVPATRVYFNRCPDQRNLIFGGYCWHAIRTTETGGLKILYNGVPVDGKCESNRPDHKVINQPAIGENLNLSGEFVYGDAYTINENDNTFTLVNTFNASWTQNTYEPLLGKFTCKSSETTCSTLYQVNTYISYNSARVSAYEVAPLKYSVIGRSDIVGRPLTDALINRNATVTLCHSKTKNIEMYTSQADIIISAVGKPNLINKEMVKEGFIGIDVGINKVGDKIVGDFNENVKEKASYLTPVPGGVGPMTIAMLISNLIELKKGQ